MKNLHDHVVLCEGTEISMATFHIPRIMFAAPASGSGKTMLTCGLLKALANRGHKVVAYKCGPDYIDPMFHTTITGIPCRNLDTFFSTQDEIAEQIKISSTGMDIAVMEGVMGYFDGIAGITTEASSYDLADKTDTPVVLVVNTKGMSLSVVALIKGFLAYEKRKHIVGVILNQTSPMLYGRLKEAIEKELPIKVFGYCPVLKETFAGSRYLGLQMPQEITDLQDKVEQIAAQLEQTIDMDALFLAASKASQITCKKQQMILAKKKIKIAVARDEAFCFYYQDNLDLLEQMGAELIPFSPLHDRRLPDRVQGIVLGGGYPELFAQKLSDNLSMRQSLFDRLGKGLPYLAECGGFLYLLDTIKNAEGKEYQMIGFLKGKAYPTGKLTRFGYITLKSKKDNPFLSRNEMIKAHEFHYFDTDANGADFLARKPQSDRSWDCIQVCPQGIAGFPHLYYPSNPHIVQRFLNCCDTFLND